MKITLKAKILFSVLACFLAVWLPSLVILYSHMNREVFRASGEAMREQIERAVSDVNDSLYSIVDATAWICEDRTVAEAFGYESLDDEGAAYDVFMAQSRISAFMAASPVWDYLNKIVIFSPESEIFFEYARWRSGTLSDAVLIEESRYFQQLSFPNGSVVHLELGTTLNRPYENAVIAYGRIRENSAYVYAEFSADIFAPLLDVFEGMYIISEEMMLPRDIPPRMLDTSQYSSSVYPLEVPGMQAVYYQKLEPLSLFSSYGAAVFLVIFAATLLLFIIVSVLLSRYLTKASSRLVRHIEYLMETKDFGYTDKSIEKGRDEIAAIGHAVNAMSLSIAALLERNEALFEEKKRMEIDMLQLQVNPHFLYNTLESMHYLAEIQKNDGIARMSRGLSTLLRNLAKGSSDKILLSEELSLLGDYDEIQQVRYMGMYEIIYSVPEPLLAMRIQKFTLQPLVENAIFHGIEPSGEYGTITISASAVDDDLYIYITDNGVGMTEDEVKHIFDERKHSKTDMTGVGVRNINDRIRLIYGEGYGLSFDSEKGKGTRVTVKIKAERGEDV